MEIMPNDGLAGSEHGPTMRVDRCIRRFVTERKPCCASRITGGGGKFGSGAQWGYIGDCRVRSDGTTLMSYDQPIARWRKRTLDIECRQFSLTTSGHQNEVGGAARRAGIPTVCRRMAGQATFEHPRRSEWLGPDDPHPNEAWRIGRFSRTAKGAMRVDDRRRLERTSAAANALQADIKRKQAANRRWAARHYEAAEWFAQRVEALRMNAPRSWDEAKERRGLEDDIPHPEVWTDRNERHMNKRMRQIKGRAEWMLEQRRPRR